MGTEEWDLLAGPREQDEGAIGVRTGSLWRQEAKRGQLETSANWGRAFMIDRNPLSPHPSFWQRFSL